MAVQLILKSEVFILAHMQLGKSAVSEGLREARILVLGGAGFLGSRIVRLLCDLGATPHLVLRSLHRSGRIEDLSQRCVIHTGDLTDFAFLKRVMDKVRPEVLFHAASHGGHRGQEHRDDIFNGNLLVVHNLLMATEELPNCRIIYSDSSLGQGVKTEPLKEEGIADPITYYAATKKAASLLIQQAARHEQRPITTLIPFAIYGPGEPSKRLIPTAIRAGLEGIALLLTPAGFVRDFVFVDDVAEAYLMAALNEKAIGERINIAGGKAVSNEAVVALIERALERPIEKRVGTYPPRATDTAYWCADITKAGNLLGWSPKHSLPEGIKITVEWYRKNGFLY